MALRQGGTVSTKRQAADGKILRDSAVDSTGGFAYLKPAGTRDD
jgi:hypothetical protein